MLTTANRGRGFTVVELLIVIVVITILAAISVVAYSGIQDRARRSAIDTTISQVSKKIEVAKVDNADNYPSSVTDCPIPTGKNICLSNPDTTYRYKPLQSAAAAGYSGVLTAPAYEISVEDSRQFGFKSTAEIRGINEYMQYMDMKPLIDKYGLRRYELRFDLKADTPGPVEVYLQNGNGSHYEFNQRVTVTTSFANYTITVTPVVSLQTETKSVLAFYGIYGSGRIPTVKNVQIRLAP